LLEYVTAVGEYFQAQLQALARKHECMKDVRGKGLMLAAELDSADLAKQVVAEMLKRRIVINCTSDTVLRFLPPYVLERKHVDEAVKPEEEVMRKSLAAKTAANQTTGGTSRG